MKKIMIMLAGITALTALIGGISEYRIKKIVLRDQFGTVFACMVKEIYVCDGAINKSKEVLMIDDDGRISLTFYLGDAVIPEHEPVLVNFLRGMRIEYGVPSEIGTRASMPFLDYETGELHKSWTRIK